jgi:GNAT superfamily N-acetyltransferase
VRIETLVARPDLADDIHALSRHSWPEFMLHGDNPHWSALFDRLTGHQLLFLDGEELIAVAHTAPGRWNGRIETLPPTIDAIIERGLEVEAAGSADVFFALAAMVAPERRGRGLSARILDAMVAHAGGHGGRALLAPVRPTWKARYPLAPMERYVRWTREDGSAFDPWIRVHARRGGAILAIAPATITVARSCAEWEAWTGMRFPESGAYVVPGALEPVVVDRERDVVRYRDPNVWMRHDVDAAAAGRSPRGGGSEP